MRLTRDVWTRPRVDKARSRGGEEAKVGEARKLGIEIARSLLDGLPRSCFVQLFVSTMMQH